MDDPTPDAAAFLDQDTGVPAADEAAAPRQFAPWATPEQREFLFQITSKVANSVLPAEWKRLPPSDPGAQEIHHSEPTAEQLLAESGYVMLRERATGRESTPNPDWTPVVFPGEQVLHFCRLWALIETGYMARGIWALVKIVGDAEHELKSAPEDAAAMSHLNTAMSQLDLAMEGWIAQHAEVKRLVDIVYRLLVTDDEDESLRFDPDADNMVRISI